MKVQLHFRTNIEKMAEEKHIYEIANTLLCIYDLCNCLNVFEVFVPFSLVAPPGDSNIYCHVLLPCCTIFNLESALLHAETKMSVFKKRTVYIDTLYYA